MLKTIKDKQLETVIATGKAPKGFPSDLIRVTQRKAAMLNAATSLDDLRIPPANNLEALSGDREGQHSIRVNDQFRLCFVWNDGIEDLEFVDYH